MRILAVAAIAAAALLPAAASAQSGLDGRVGKLESEMRAVQRKVFPGGAGATLQPEIAPEQAPPAVGGIPATSALADLSGRVTALEGQMASMTNQIEQNGYQVRQLQDQFDAYKRATETRLKALEPNAPAAAAGDTGGATGTPGAGEMGSAVAATGATRPARRGAANDPVAPATSVPASTVAGVEKPNTGDAPEDEYLYGFRLWTAKAYPQAEAQLKKVVATYPKHRRASYAQNLLGRAYLDEGKPSLASMAFYDNYKKMPDGERAPDSLYYLAQALVKLNKPADACKVYGELTDVYGGKIGAGMKADVAKGRAAAKCG